MILPRRASKEASVAQVWPVARDLEAVLESAAAEAPVQLRPSRRNPGSGVRVSGASYARAHGEVAPHL
jgi:hypothetical protein